MKRRLGDRRGRPRFEIVGELRGTLDYSIGLPLVNVGRHGALVESSVALTPQSIHHVAFPNEGHQTRARVRVRHVRPATGPDGAECFLIGLEFLSMSSAFEAQIDEWMGSGGQLAREGV